MKSIEQEAAETAAEIRAEFVKKSSVLISEYAKIKTEKEVEIRQIREDLRAGLDQLMRGVELLKIGHRYKLRFPNEKEPECEIECKAHGFGYNHEDKTQEPLYTVIEIRRTKKGEKMKNLRERVFSQSQLLRCTIDFDL